MSPNEPFHRKPKKRGAKVTATFTPRLRELRESERRTQEDVAEKSKISTDTLRRAESGGRVSIETAVSIASVLWIEDKDLSDFRADVPKSPSDSSQCFVDNSVRMMGLFPPLVLPPIDETEDARFLYNSNRLEFLGREAAIDKLEEFISHPKNFRWWLIVGAGGIGKSRLAYEFCKNLDGEVWERGFLPTTDDHKTTDQKDIELCLAPWKNWQPAKPTLIVVDYVAEHARFLGNMVYCLARRSEADQLTQPVRLLLLEREAEGEWEKNFRGEHDVIRSFQRTTNHSTPLKIDSLDDDALWDIIQQMSDSREEERPDLLENLRSIDPLCRPLFAAFLGDAVKRSEFPRHWDLDALIKDVLERDQKEFWIPAGVTESDQAWLCLATMTGGAFGAWLEELAMASPHFPAQLPTIKDSGLDRRYRVMAGLAPIGADTIYRPLQPDILGEFFVLKHLTQGQRAAWSKDIPLWLKVAWEMSPSHMAVFLGRLGTDFIDYREFDNSDPLPYFFAAPASNKINVKFSWGAMMLDRINYFAQHSTPAKVISLCGEVLDHFEDASDPVFGRFVTSALLGKMTALTKLGSYDEVVAACDILLARSNASLEPYVGKMEKIGAALFGKANALGKLGHLEEAITAFDAALVSLDSASDAIPDAVRADFDDAFEQRVRRVVIPALIGKALFLRELGRIAEAKTTIKRAESTLENIPAGEDAARYKAMLADVQSLLK